MILYQMKLMELKNPFGAPVYYEERVSSTMDISRELAARGEPSGTVIAADFQDAGRGRIQKRVWEMESGAGLAFTMLLRYPSIEAIPPALTLHTGLALCLAIEDFLPALKNAVQVKWPNDIMISTLSKTTAGILTEADGGTVHIGIGINVGQKDFPAHLKEKAASLGMAAGLGIEPCQRFTLLEKILARLYSELWAEGPVGTSSTWRSRLESRLFKNGEQVDFIDGAADSGKAVKGRLAGIGPTGELLLLPDGETQPRSFFAGELLY
jgi:BirA family biotin operon repressor/biotin-[acetyl-CoA-carboxylase] ligase